MRCDAALKLHRARLSMILARLREQGIDIDSDSDSADTEGATDSEFTADNSVIGADVPSNEAAAAACDDSMEPGDFNENDDDISFDDCMELCDLLGAERVAKRSRTELES
jgi:hypothetical protein